jgi:DNA-binding transcriptional LysR family regulator
MIDYTLRELECFHAVAEELNFTRAAERLHLSQPPLSRHIRTLEERLGISLFERNKQRVALTSAGRLFLSETRGLLEHLTRAQQRVRDHASGVRHSLDIAFVGALLSENLTRALSDYQKTFPEVALTLHDKVPADQLRAFKKGSVDLGFIGPEPNELPTGITITPWMTEPLCAFMPDTHELAGRKRISIARLRTHSLVTVSHEAAPAYHHWLREKFVDAGVQPLIVQRADRAQAVCTMSAVSGHIALLTKSACAEIEGCVSIPVTGQDGRFLQLTHVIATRSNGPEQARYLLEALTRPKNRA